VLLADESPIPAVPVGLDQASRMSFPASDPIAVSRDHPGDKPTDVRGREAGHDWPSRPAPVTFDDGSQATIDNGHVVIAAITSCTNTSNPSVMVAAG
jgi:aconitate hydratase